VSGNAQENRHPTRPVLADQAQNRTFLHLTSNFVVPNIFLCRLDAGNLMLEPTTLVGTVLLPIYVPLFLVYMNLKT
jgi:hypothetical protein